MASVTELAAGRQVLLVEKHKAFVKDMGKKTDEFEYAASEHLRMSGVYWGLTTMALLGHLQDMDATQILPWLLSCQQPGGGFGGNVGHDAHILYTLSALQVLALYDQLDLIDSSRVATYIAGLQREDGAFAGDEWGEIDTRFSYCAISSLSILGRLSSINLPAAVDFIASCQNFDGGFGATPGGESHAGQIFCCVAALHIAGAIDRCNADLLGWWLSERQLASGGLNGRPEKLPDVCYSWWVLSALALLRRLHWIDRPALQRFILDCQDEEGGGISDRPDDMVDIFHTFFGIAGSSLLGYPGVEAVDPAYALPVSVVTRLLKARG
eukprot:jgi/Mesen1/8911/ME000541S08302